MDAPRPLTHDDAEALLPLIRGLAAHHGGTATPNAGLLRRDLRDGWLWGFGIGAPLVAYALVHPAAVVHRGARGVELHHLFVAEDHRRRGHARRLIAAVEADAIARGCGFVRIGAETGNLGARACYEAAGYAFREAESWRFHRVLQPSGAISSTSSPPETEV